ncbi:membrane-anchored junction protein isoform X2 [Neolamprologus brichardi]|uniref:membrane-anchored junction protein isoform X2 n=1 Tax=Neolamprologus brichardi TaxID=32507 RepID=UPI0003EBDD9B|nr:membrane-anchored junction protein isoform X2 [Neolamprologus brichardi]
MPLQAFSFPLPETRLFKAGSFIYKFTIRGGSSYSQQDVMGKVAFNQELEEIIRTVLGNLDDLQPFSSTHYIIFPYKKQWESVCKYDEMNLSVYPFTLILYLEKNMQNGSQSVEEDDVTQHIPSIPEPQLKRDSPLEEAILKDLINDMEAENRVAVTGKLDLVGEHSRGKTKEDPGHVDKPEIVLQEQGTHVRPGFLKQLASHVFPFSLFVKDPEN